MIRGTVNARREALLQLRVRRDVGGPELNLPVIVDTGFTGALTLPTTVVAALNLARQSGGRAVLADGSVRQFDLHGAEVEWDGTWRPILASAVGDEALLGMRLLSGSVLRVEVVPGGAVEISPPP